jgi:hypothetical protein
MIESLSYRDLGERLGISAEAARAYARRKRWPRSIGNDGAARIQCDLGEVNRPAAAPRTTELLAQLASLRDELTEARRTAAGHRADFEHERDRCDRLAADLMRLTAELMAARRPWWRWSRG